MFIFYLYFREYWNVFRKYIFNRDADTALYLLAYSQTLIVVKTFVCEYHFSKSFRNTSTWFLFLV